MKLFISYVLYIPVLGNSYITHCVTFIIITKMVVQLITLSWRIFLSYSRHALFARLERGIICVIENRILIINNCYGGEFIHGLLCYTCLKMLVNFATWFLTKYRKNADILDFSSKLKRGFNFMLHIPGVSNILVYL